jgi:hypothetical protein
MPSKKDLDRQIQQQKKMGQLINLVVHRLTGPVEPSEAEKINAFVNSDPANKTWFDQITNWDFLANEIREYTKPDLQKASNKFWALIAKEDAQNP